MITDIRVGIPAMGGRGWLGGVSHIELIVKAVASLPREERPRLFLVVYDLDNYELYKPFAALFDGLLLIGDAGLAAALPGAVWCKSEGELFDHIDFYFPVNFNVLPGRCSASWIHDFQHHYLPELFSPREIETRTALCRKIADHARLVYCSSRAVESDFRRLYPHSPAHTRVLPLRVAPDDSWFAGDPAAVQAAYGLPASFVLCCNQFWQHKNHRRLFAAIALLRRQGRDVHLACTGATSDFRRPHYFAELAAYIDELGIADLVHVLGLIPRHDQVQLIRRSLFVVQPSLFEGLSLIVQECRALGKPIILSDLDVHREHEYGVYFQSACERDLADKLAALLPAAVPGPDLPAEAFARLQAAGLACDYARQFCRLVEDALHIYRQPVAVAPSFRPDGGAITVATSLTTAVSAESQRRAVDSWLRLGFKVLSVSGPAEAAALAPLFPEVAFRTPLRPDGGTAVSLGEMASALEDDEAEVCGLVEPDTCLYGSRLAEIAWQDGRDGLVYGERIGVEALAGGEKPPLPAYGYFFFPKILLPALRSEDFPFGQPWWDVWTAFSLLLQKTPLKKVSTLFAYRITRPREAPAERWVELGRKLAGRASSGFPLAADNIGKFHCIIGNVLAKHSSVVDA